MIEREPCFKWIIRQELELIKKTIKNPVLLDIGANIGDYVFLMHKIMNGVSHKIVAVEANPEVYKILKENISDSEIKCKILNEAISDVTGEKTFYIADKNNLGSVVYRDGISKKEITIKSKTLQDLKLEKINFIKMDIEGGEVLALRGARNFLKDQNELKILLEIHPIQYNEELNLKKELEFLFDSGWKCKYMISSAMPYYYSSYMGLRRIWESEIIDGWKRMVFINPDIEAVIFYGCQGIYGVPNWRGTVSRKLMRGLLLEK